MTTWTAKVHIRDTRHWHSVTLKIEASTLWHAGRQFLVSAKAALPRGTRVEEVRLTMLRVHHPKPAGREPEAGE